MFGCDGFISSAWVRELCNGKRTPLGEEVPPETPPPHGVFKAVSSGMVAGSCICLSEKGSIPATKTMTGFTCNRLDDSTACGIMCFQQPASVGAAVPEAKPLSTCEAASWVTPANQHPCETGGVKHPGVCNSSAECFIPPEVIFKVALAEGSPPPPSDGDAPDSPDDSEVDDE